MNSELPEPWLDNPHDNLLGCLMNNQDRFAEVAIYIEDEDFEKEHQKYFWNLFSKLHRQGHPIDGSLVFQDVAKDENRAKGFHMKLVDLMTNAPFTINPMIFVEEIKKRSTEAKAKEIGRSIYDDPEQEKLGDYAGRLNELTRMKATKPTKAREVLAEFVDDFQNRRLSDKRLLGLSTGFDPLDENLGGYCKGNMYVIAARPGIGKTAFALNSFLQCVFQNKHCIFFSLEMPNTQIVERLLSTYSEIDLGKIRNPKSITSETQLELLEEKYLKLDELGKYFDIYDDSLTVEKIRDCAVNFKSQHGGNLDIIFIDYLGLIKATSANMHREQQVSHISNNLKYIAKDLDVPVVVLSQLNRGVEARPNKIPILSDLRDSGAIEQDADVIMFLYRDSYYTKSSFDDSAQLDIAKNRHGALGSFIGKFTGATQKFEFNLNH